ncbi:MAG: UvrD-helicase domain-containing protein [Clostridia bacterium]|nr:UvrD-helicase domain-containing protein [Clostridia bacterium]
MEFTDDQITAIYADNHTLLVSAAAGSGKTAVLVERIVRLVLQGDRINRMLIVTFTRSAAAEMKERLRRRLQECAAQAPERIDRAMADLEVADIGTIHAFCQRFLREEFQAALIDPTARVCRDDEKARLFDESARAALNELLTEGTEAFRDFAASFTVAEILAMNDRLYHFLMALSKPFDWLEEKVAAAEKLPVEDQDWMRAVRERWAGALAGIRQSLALYARTMDDPLAVAKLTATVDADTDLLMPALNAAERGDVSLAVTLLPEKFSRALPVTKPAPATAAWHEGWKKARNTLLKAVEKLREDADAVSRPADELERDVRQIASSLRSLQRLTVRTHELFIARKREERVIDFSDMEQMTYDLLTDEKRPEYRERWADAYEHIFVDECQDVSQIQNDIIAALQGDVTNLFLVGDVKQSIYRFRQANPTLFIDRIAAFSRAKNAARRALFLSQNFRSAEPVIDAVNAVFGRAMSGGANEIDYTPDDRLVQGRTDGGNAPVTVRILESAKANASARLAFSVDAAVREIRSVVGTEKPGGGKYRCGDIAILMPRLSRQGESVVHRMRDQGIPVYYDGRDAFFDLPEIRAFHSLLVVMQSPTDDIALLAVMKGAPFRFTDRELGEIRRRYPKKQYRWHEAFFAMCGEEETGALAEKCRRCRETLREWRFRRETLRLHEYIWYLLRESGLYAAMGARPGGEQRQGNLRILARKADDMEARGKSTLAAFLDEISGEMESDDGRSAHQMGENEDDVRLMTIHKSKGLQFPVVILLDLESPIHGRKNGLPLIHRNLGVCLPYVNRTLGIRRPCYAERLFAQTLDEDERAERCRVLYVAMTRAQDRLLVIACPGDKEPDAWSRTPDAARAAEVTSMADWLIQAASDLADEADSPFSVVREEARENEQAEAAAPALATSVAGAAVGALKWWDGLLAEREGLSARPLKTSVSSLVRRSLEPPDDDEETAEDKRREDLLRTPILLSEVPAEPDWLVEGRHQAGGAKRGTANHHFLSLVPLDALREAGNSRLLSVLADALRDMREKHILTEQEAALVSLRQCAAFFRSQPGREMLASPRVEREWRFNLLLGDDPSGGQTILQGIIDAAFLTGETWTLLDYKTDRIEDRDLFIARHAEQLNWYAEAVAQLTGRPAERLLLWSLSLGEVFTVPRRAPIVSRETLPDSTKM